MCACADEYIRSILPPALVIPDGMAQHESIRRKPEYDKITRHYNEGTDVDRSLKRQLAQALDPVYVRSFRDPMTNQMLDTIPAIMEDFFSSYSYVELEILSELESKIRDMNYVIHDPIVTIFCEIEDLRDLAIAAQNPYTPAQLVNFAIKIIRKLTDFEDDLCWWDTKLLADKTCTNLKIHFREEHKILRKLRGKTMHQAGFQTANNLATKVMTELGELETRVMDALDERDQEMHTQPPPPPPPPPTNDENQHPSE